MNTDEKFGKLVLNRALKGDGGYPGSAKLAWTKGDQISAIVDPENEEVPQDDKTPEFPIWIKVRVD